MNSGPPPPELMSFIERQEEYIDQLEKESQYCRDELSQLLGKVKDLIAENEALHEQQKTGVIKSVFEGVGSSSGEVEHTDKFRKRLEGPLIVFESRISELEAQLTQTKMDLRKAQEEAEMYRKRLEEANPTGASSEFFKQIENLQREKRELHESLTKLQATIVQIREKEMDASKKVQRTLDVVDKTQFEKQQAELEVNRLKSELEHQHDKLLEVISEQTRKLAEERGQAERRYLQHVEQLNNELASQRDANSKLQLELERRLRAEEDLKRDLSAKNMTIENVKKELNNKIASLQNDLSTALAERDSIEQELSTSRMSGERTDRLNRQETSRLQIEISSLRQRLDRTDAELMHSRRENLRLLEQISTQEKEITLLKIKLGEGKDGLKEPSPLENEINSRISEIESKHVETVTELEGLIENQAQVMAQLKAECQSLTQKLEDSAARHKEEMANLQSNLDYLTSKLESTLSNQQWSSGSNAESSRQTEVVPQESNYQGASEQKEEMRTFQQPESYQQQEFATGSNEPLEAYDSTPEPKQSEIYEDYNNAQQQEQQQQPSTDVSYDSRKLSTALKNRRTFEKKFPSEKSQIYLHCYLKS
ncbi:UNVERIFIED_CONTAM: hypothetical protein PYX00_006844 [Menopon gallinae]|uniref:Uncharacterized protein n=1 Tax=Menopon gallinae TaxID=328185 RepID=A0AAW2HYK6_9NEOP